MPRKPVSSKSGPARERCDVCGEVGLLGTCDFGKGNPFFVGAPHCRACCTRPERDRWRSLAESEGSGVRSESRMRRILKQYASAYAALLGRIHDAPCGHSIRPAKRLT